MTNVPDRLHTAETELAEAFEQLHRENNVWRQTNPHLREAVSTCSAALAAVRRAIGHAERVYTTEMKR